MRLVIGGSSGSAPRIDATILKATARARRWFDDLVSRRAASMVEIGQREGIGKRYVSRLIRLAFLAPAIVERIVANRIATGVFSKSDKDAGTPAGGQRVWTYHPFR